MYILTSKLPAKCADSTLGDPGVRRIVSRSLLQDKPNTHHTTSHHTPHHTSLMPDITSSSTRVLATENLRRGGSTDHIHFQKTILCIYYTHLSQYIHFCKAGRDSASLYDKWTFVTKSTWCQFLRTRKTMSQKNVNNSASQPNCNNELFSSMVKLELLQTHVFYRLTLRNMSSCPRVRPTNTHYIHTRICRHTK